MAFLQKLIQILSNPRLVFGLIAAFCLAAIGVAMAMQHIFGLEPCALCISQRIAIIAVGFVALLACIHNPITIGIRIYSCLGVIFALIGSIISIRHVWIQSLPEEEAPLCGPGLTYMFETRPIFDALSLLLKGDGNCADVLFTFLGLSIPGWTLVAFAGLILANIWAFFHAQKIMALP